MNLTRFWRGYARTENIVHSSRWYHDWNSNCISPEYRSG